MKGIPVKYNGVIVGWSDDESNGIKFEDNEEAKKIKQELLAGQNISISSRAIGQVDEKGKVYDKEIFESVIIKDKDLSNE